MNKYRIIFKKAGVDKEDFPLRTNGIRVVRKDSCKKREVGKSDMKLERMKLESSCRSWKVRAEVGKCGLKLESTTEVGK